MVELGSRNMRISSPNYQCSRVHTVCNYKVGRLPKYLRLQSVDIIIKMAHPTGFAVGWLRGENNSSGGEIFVRSEWI